MATAPQLNLMTEAEYLSLEQTSDERHEFVDGQVYAMTGAHAHHNRIAGSVYRRLGNHLEGKPCQPYMADMKLRVAGKYFYPDVMVDCSRLDGYFSESPCLIVEVLSKSTRRMDKGVKLMAYTQIPSLEEYVLIEQDFVEVQVLRRRDGWFPHSFYLGDEVTLESVGLTMSVEAIYERVVNEDVEAWVREQRAGYTDAPAPAS
jgi:Uma2 family endonuclease